MLWLWQNGAIAMLLLWLGVWLGRSSRPLSASPEQWLVWSRLHGGWERLRIFAIIVAFCWLVISVLVGIQGISSSLSLHRDPCYRALNYSAMYSNAPETWQGVRRPLPNDCT